MIWVYTNHVLRVRRYPVGKVAGVGRRGAGRWERRARPASARRAAHRAAGPSRV